ncbi:tetratricopeptide repeat protein [Sphaerothrix gracilis]|uniref:tetratricopeptide repeat protein n=1 Tax=Sphaerothrix gracilis TaxID=3151835 RepID=UPI0031FDEAFC
MPNFLNLVSDYAFSGIPSNAVYDLIKRAWQTITHKTWEELYIIAFQAAIEESRPYLMKYAASDGVIEIDRAELQRILHQDFNIDATTFSELNSDEFVSTLALAMANQSVLIIGGHPLSNQDYTHLIHNLIEQVKIHFKQSVLSDPTILNRVLLEESLKNQNLAKETSTYLINQFGLVLSKLEEIEAKVKQIVEDRPLPTTELAKEISTRVSVDTFGALTLEYQAELDYAKELINKYQPQQALNYLESLKQRIEHQSQPTVKYRLLANMGAARLSMNQSVEAAKLFIQAYNLNKDDDNARYYAALGYALLEQYDEAKKLIHQVLESNPTHERAYTVLVQIYPEDNLQALIEKIPVYCRNSSSVAYALSHVARQQLDFEQAEFWLQVALEKDSDSFETQAAYGTLLLQLVNADPWLVQSRQFNEEDQKKLQKANQLLTDAWEKVVDTELHNFRSDIIINRSTTRRLLNRLEEAIQDADIALKIEPDNSTFIRINATLAYENSDSEKAIRLLERILESGDTPEAPILLADILRDVGEYDRSIEIAKCYLQQNPDSPLSDAAHKIIMQSCVESKNAERAIEIFNLIQEKESKSLNDLVNAATIAIFLNEKSVAVKLLREAKGQIDASTLKIQVSEAADRFYTLGEFLDAAQLYEVITDFSLDTPYSRTLIKAYYHSGQYRKALNLCQILRQSHGISIALCEIESSIQESINNLTEAKYLCQECLTKFPDALLIKLRLALINYRLEKFDELDVFLNSPVDVAELPFELAVQLTDLYGARSLTDKFFESLYKIRKKFYGKSIAHVNYVTRFFEREKNSDSFLVFHRVCVNSAVYLQDESGQVSSFVIEDKQSVDFRHNEINLEDSRTQKLLNKAVGDEVVFKDDFISKDVRKIVEVTSKYVYALRESLDLLEKQFSETPGFWTLKVDLSESTNGLPKNLKSVLDKSSESIREAEKLYKTSHIPIGTFAKLTNKDIPSTWGHFISSPELGIFCCQGNQEERSHALSLLAIKPLRLIIDIISLLTIHGLGAADAVVRAFGRLGIAQSTIDILRDVVEDYKGMKSNGTAFLGTEGGHFFLHEVTAEEIQRSREYFEKIIIWVKNNCEILPCTAALDMEQDERRELEKLLGNSSFDTLLIASEPGNLLYSDDWALRQVAKSRFKLDGAWTQAVLLRCQELTTLEQSEYSEIVVKLVRSNYRYTSIDDHALIAAAKQADWLPNEPFISLLRLLENTQRQDSLILNGQADRIALSSVIGVAVNFLYRLWEQDISVQRKHALGISLLNSLMRGRHNLNSVLSALASGVSRKSFIILPYELEILFLIRQWRNHYYA